MGQELTSFVVHQWQCDHYGHLNVRNYAAMFDDAVFVFWAKCQLEPGQTVVPVTASLNIRFESEASAGTVAKVEAKVGRIGEKSVTLTFEMIDVATRRALATCEVVEVFFDRSARKSHGIPETIRTALESHLN